MQLFGTDAGAMHGQCQLFRASSMAAAVLLHRHQTRLAACYKRVMQLSGGQPLVCIVLLHPSVQPLSLRQPSVVSRGWRLRVCLGPYRWLPSSTCSPAGCVLDGSCPSHEGLCALRLCALTARFGRKLCESKLHTFKMPVTYQFLASINPRSSVEGGRHCQALVRP